MVLINKCWEKMNIGIVLITTRKKSFVLFNNNEIAISLLRQIYMKCL